MTNDPLNNIKWKLWRARENCEVIDEITKAFIHSDFYTLSQQIDRKGRLTLRVDTVKPMPPQISLLIGETAHHIRSSLDHLMFLLANPAPGEEDKVQFPLYSSRKRFNEARKISKKGKSRFDDLMPNVPRGVKTLVERVQPYHCRKWPETLLLGQIQTLDNWDKHRTFSTTAASLESFEVTFEITGPHKGWITNQRTYLGVIKPGKKVGSAQLGGTWEVGAEIKPNIKPGFLPVFDDIELGDIHRCGILGIIGSAGDFVENTILPMFEPFIPR